MIKPSHKLKKSSDSPQKNASNRDLSIFSFFKQTIQIIKEKSDNAVNKIHAKLIEDPTVYKLPIQIRKKLKSQDKSPVHQQKSLSKQKLSEVSKSKSKINEQDSRKLSQLLKKKHDLMARLRKIDQQLHNPSMMPVTMEGSNNSSFVNSQHDRILSHKISQSRLNYQQRNAYNVVQHERTMEMLSRINNQKMRRQQKIVRDMKKKQEKQIQKLEQLQKNKSKIQLSRGNRNMQILRAINKKQTDKLHDTQTGMSNPQNYHSEPKQLNQFDQIEDIQIGPGRISSQQNGNSFPDINN